MATYTFHSTVRFFNPLALVASGSLLFACGDDSVASVAVEAAETIAPLTAMEQQAAGILSAHRAEGEFLGASLAMIDSAGNRSQLSIGTVGAAADSEPVDPETPWMIGSVTKTFVTVVILQLVEEGRLALDDTVEGFFPELPRASEISVRNLLQHTSGLNDYLTSELVLNDAQRAWSPAELIGVAVNQGARSAPGGKHSYSNTNFQVLGELIEQVTERPWYTEVRARILEPLSMDTTHYQDEPGAPASGVGFLRTDNGFVESTTSWHHSLGGATGGMVSTTSDLLDFAISLYEGELLSSESESNMRSFVPAEDYGYIDYQYGLGFMMYGINDLTMYGHLGSSNSHATYMGFDPASGSALALALNVQDAGPAALTAAELLGLLTEKDVSPPSE